MKVEKVVAFLAVLLASTFALADTPADVGALGSSVVFSSVTIGILAIASGIAAVLSVKKGARWVLSMLGR